MCQVARPDVKPSDHPRAYLSHPDALYEVVDGEVVELSERGVYATIIANRFWFALLDDLGERPGGRALLKCLFILDAQRDLRRRPDVAFISFDRWPADREIPEEGDWDVVPDLMIVVVSPHDTNKEVLRKVREYSNHGARQVWTVHPSERLVYIYSAPTAVRIYGPDDTIDGGELLPGFRLPVEPLFRRTVG